MAKAPDWLMNTLATSPSLVDDSPQFRAAQNKEQWDNLHSAANEALDQVRDQTEASQAQTALHQFRALDAITPTPTPLAGPDSPFHTETDPNVATPLSPNIPGPSDFAPNGATPASSASVVGAPPEDPAAEVQRIAEATGIPAQTVASMAMLGGDIGKIEQARQQQQPQMPAPNGPAPLMQAPPPPPQAPAGPQAPQAPPPAQAAPPTYQPPIPPVTQG